jgi:tRNA threonylcarbamoyladenosine biosynthesis protein TsaE
MTGDHRTIHLADSDATDALGAALARDLPPGSTVLLEGPIGAGKSTLARALIRAALDDPGAEVPSPSYTIAQAYDAPGGRIWHLDLYRLASTDELTELGLDEVLGRETCLIEWPDRLGSLTPDRAIRFRLLVAGEGRVAEVDGWRG